MANGDHDWTASEVVTAANVDDYLQLQTIEKYATSAARDAALTTRKREGMHTYQDDANSDTVYSGAAWSTIGPLHGALTAWTPTVTQSVSVTVTNTYSRYMRVGRVIDGWFVLTVTGAGTASNAIIIGGLPFTAANAPAPAGVGEMLDQSASIKTGFNLFLESTTTFNLRVQGNTPAVDNRLGLQGTTAGLAVNDTLSGWFRYEAAADA